MSKKINDDELANFLKQNEATYDELEQKFGVHRTTIFRAMERLKSSGFKIDNSTKDRKKLFTIGPTSSRNPELPKAATRYDKMEATEKSRDAYNEVSEALNEIYSEIDDFEKEPTELPESGEIAVLYVGDTHIGSVAEQDGKIIYDSEKAKQKIEQLDKNTRKMTNFIQQGKDLVEFDFAFLGDIIENDIVYENQKYEIDKAPLDQVREATEKFVPLIKNYADEFRQVRIYTVKGNHGRMNKEGHDSSNWDQIFYNMLKLGLKDEENIHIDIGEGKWNEFEVYNKKIGITHELYYQAATSAGEDRHLRQITSRDLDEIHQGHKHKRASDEILGNMVYWNGAVKPSGQYEEELGVDSIPSQTLMTYSEDRGVTGIHFIDLRNSEEDDEKQL